MGEGEEGRFENLLSIDGEFEIRKCWRYTIG